MSKQKKENNVIRPMEGKQELFINIKDDGVDDNGLAVGKGSELDFVFYGGGGKHAASLQW